MEFEVYKVGETMPTTFFAEIGAELISNIDGCKGEVYSDEGILKIKWDGDYHDTILDKEGFCVDIIRECDWD